MNALAIILLFAVPALMLVTGQILKRVIGRKLGEPRQTSVAVPVLEAPAVETRAAGDARVA